MSTDPTNPSPEPTPKHVTAGQRLDKFIAKGKELGAQAAHKAKELSDQAAPHIRHAAGAVADKSKVIGKAAVEEFKTQDKKNSKLKFYLIGIGAGLFLVFVIFVVVVASFLFGSSPAPTKANFAKITSGMSIEQIHKIMGTETEYNEIESMKTQYYKWITKDGSYRIQIKEDKLISKQFDEPESPNQTQSSIAPQVNGSQSVSNSGANNATQEQIKHFWSRHSGRWKIYVKEPNFDLIFILNVSTEKVNLISWGARHDGKEQLSSGDGATINGPVVTPLSFDTADLKFQMMAKVHRMILHFSEKEISGTASEGERVSGNIQD